MEESPDMCRHGPGMSYTDMPGPGILGLPTSGRLKVITLNCAVRSTHESPKLLDKESYNMVRPKWF